MYHFSIAQMEDQIDRLTKHPEEISHDWWDGIGLFQMISNEHNPNAGCLTMIRENSLFFKACINGEVDEKITSEIANDERLPRGSLIYISHLPIFLEWHKKIYQLENKLNESTINNLLPTE